MSFPSTWFLDTLATTLVRGEETDMRFALVQFDLPAGSQPPLHEHSDADEGFYVLEGQITLWSGDTEVDLAPGEFFQAPRGVPHTYRVGQENARALVTVSPAGFEEFVARAGEVAKEMRLPDLRPVDPVELERIAVEYRIKILGPPGMLPSDRPAADQ